MEIFLMGISAVFAGVALFLLVRLLQGEKKIRKLAEGIECFRLYPAQPARENLNEGALANLFNSVAALEEQYLYLSEQSGQRERETERFVENMAHQIKNVLTALQIQFDLLQADCGEEASPHLAKCQGCIDRLTWETDRILKSSQLARGKIKMIFEEMDLQRETERCVKQLQPLAQTRGVTIRVRGGETFPYSGDLFWISQALENLIKNAVEHTAPDTEVTVTLADDGRFLTVLVEDEGDGIPAEELPDLFRRFHRGAAAHAGYGVGLSMAKDIAEAHHGTLAAGNRPGGGAWFRMSLPKI